ncbi:hypothetical protein GCM10008949_30340 [Deinococcus humi]|nr:hypothetical protein GCM10008949_30340 [Deinococcus humi]
MEEVSFPGLTLVQDWKADPDPASKGAFSRAYALNETPFLVYYQPTGTTGHLTLIYRSDLQPTAPAPASNASSPRFSSCAAARAAGYSNMRRGQPGYSSNLDQDNDGVACDQ